MGTSVASGIPSATGIVAIPNGHLIVSQPGNFSLFDVNPTTNSAVPFSNQYDFDGLSTDGTTLYGAAVNNGHILGVRLSDGMQVFDSGFIPGGVDGTALGTGTLAGNIFANTNSGTVYEINMTTLTQTLIASGGSRGDFVTADPNGTLLLTQTDQIKRLIAPAGGGFGPVPEPSTLTLLGLGVLGLLGYGWRRKRIG